MITPRQLVARLIEDYASNARNDEDEIGDDVTVVRGGQEYTGKIGEIDPKDPQHRVKVSFRGARPPGDEFKPDELRRDDAGPGGAKRTKPVSSGRDSSVPPVATRSGDRGPGSFL